MGDQPLPPNPSYPLPCKNGIFDFANSELWDESLNINKFHAQIMNITDSLDLIMGHAKKLNYFQQLYTSPYLPNQLYHMKVNEMTRLKVLEHLLKGVSKTSWNSEVCTIFSYAILLACRPKSAIVETVKNMTGLTADSAFWNEGPRSATVSRPRIAFTSPLSSPPAAAAAASAAAASLTPVRTALPSLTPLRIAAPSLGTAKVAAAAPSPAPVPSPGAPLRGVETISVASLFYATAKAAAARSFIHLTNPPPNTCVTAPSMTANTTAEAVAAPKSPHSESVETQHSSHSNSSPAAAGSASAGVEDPPTVPMRIDAMGDEDVNHNEETPASSNANSAIKSSSASRRKRGRPKRIKPQEEADVEMSHNSRSDSVVVQDSSSVKQTSPNVIQIQNNDEPLPVLKPVEPQSIQEQDNRQSVQKEEETPKVRDTIVSSAAASVPLEINNQQVPVQDEEKDASSAVVSTEITLQSNQSPNGLISQEPGEKVLQGVERMLDRELNLLGQRYKEITTLAVKEAEEKLKDTLVAQNAIIAKQKGELETMKRELEDARNSQQQAQTTFEQTIHDLKSELEITSKKLTESEQFGKKQSELVQQYISTEQAARLSHTLNLERANVDLDKVKHKLEKITIDLNHATTMKHTKDQSTIHRLEQELQALKQAATKSVTFTATHSSNASAAAEGESISQQLQSARSELLKVENDIRTSQTRLSSVGEEIVAATNAKRQAEAQLKYLTTAIKNATKQHEDIKQNIQTATGLSSVAAAATLPQPSSSSSSSFNARDESDQVSNQSSFMKQIQDNVKFQFVLLANQQGEALAKQVRAMCESQLSSISESVSSSSVSSQIPSSTAAAAPPNNKRARSPPPEEEKFPALRSSLERQAKTPRSATHHSSVH